MPQETPLDTTAAEAYEKHIVPAFMLPLMKVVFETAAPRAGEYSTSLAGRDWWHVLQHRSLLQVAL